MGYWDVQISGAAMKADYDATRKRAKQRKKIIEEKYTKPNTIRNLFDLKKFNLGWKIFQEDIGLKKQVTKKQQDFLKSSNTTDQEANIFSKLMMLNAAARDVYTTTYLTSEDEGNIKKKFKDDEHVEYTKQLNEYAKQLQDQTSQYMEQMLSGKTPKDTEQLADFEQSLNSQYTQLLNGGINEAKMYGYKISPYEGVAHQRIMGEVSQNNDLRKIPLIGGLLESITSSNIATAMQNPLDATEVEEDIIFGAQKKEKSMENFLNEQTSELQERNKQKLKNQKGYNANDYISMMFNDASDGMFAGFGQDENGNTLYKFRDSDDDTSDLKGLLGFNKWRKEGDFNELFYGEGGREKVEDLALTYAVLKEEQGEDAAKQWLQTRLQHYASEGISGMRYFENATLGFVEDVIGDATEIVGGIYGIGKGLAEGIGGSVASIWNDSSLEDVWTEAMGDAFDNGLTRWGAQLSSTGYYLPSWQKKANEIGFSYRDNIADPEKQENFLLKGGGSGIGYFLAETGRQASHTMSSVWFGKALGTLGAKGGAMLTAALGGSQKAMMKGYRIGSTVGLMASGMQEGVMDGIQVRDDIYKQGIQQVEQEIAERAIFAALNNNTNADDPLAIAQFLAQNHVGDYETQDKNGNTIIANDLIQRDQNGNIVSALNKRQLVDLLKSSEYGQQIIEDYKTNPNTASEYQDMVKQARNSAIRNGAATALIESVINGSIRSFNTGARANIKGAEKAFRKRMASLAINEEGKVSMKKVGRKFAIQQSLSNAKHEAIEEGLQAITQKTFTAVGENSIKRHIDGVYDTDTWAGFIGEWSTTLQDIVENAGAGLADPATYEAAIQGAIGSMMGFFTLKQKGKGIKGLRPSWQGSIFNINSTVDAENEARRDLTQALQNAIDKEGGVNSLLSMASTKKSIDVYNNSIEKNPDNKHANNELAVDALVHSISTLHQIRDTEFGKKMIAHLAYQSNMIEMEPRTSEISDDELNRRHIEKAKEFLTTSVEGELAKKKEAAITEVQSWLKNQGKKVRTIEEISANPTEAEAQALVDIINTAKQTMEMSDKIAEINEHNSKNVQGLNFVAKNELNAKSLLLYNQQQRLQHANDRLTRIGEQNSPRSNTTLSTEQKQSIAIMGNTDEKRAENKKKYEESIESTKQRLKDIKKDIKAARKQLAKAKADGDTMLQTQYGVTIAMLNDAQTQLKESEKIDRDLLNRDKRTFWDIIRNKKGEEIESIAESGRVLTAYDIITLTPYEREMMLNAENKDKYSEEQQAEIEEARNILQQNQALDLIESTDALSASITANKGAINDILTNIDAYNAHVKNAEQQFRTNVLNYRYQTDTTREMDVNEVKTFVDRLNDDFEKGLISEGEKNQLIRQAVKNEKIRNRDKKQDDPNVKRGWENYNNIQNQSTEIGTTFTNGNVTVDETTFDNLMGFLSEQLLTLQQFNNLDTQEKQDLLNNSKALNDVTGGNINADEYINFAADILHLYKEAKQKGQKVNKDIARGNNNKREAEEKEVTQPEKEEPIIPAEQQGNSILQKRSAIDEVSGRKTSRFGSVLTSIIGYIENTNILQDEQYSPAARSILNIAKQVAMSDEPITSIDTLYGRIEEGIRNVPNSAHVRNVWLQIKKNIENKQKQIASANAATSPTYRDRNLREGASSSSIMHTEKISLLREDKTKRPILDFLDEHSYFEATRYAAQLSQGSTGFGGQIYYITDPTTTQRYREAVGDSYNNNNSLPIFTCIRVSENFNGAIPIKSGNETMYLVPIGILKENTQANNNASGMNYTQAIRQLAVEQQENNSTQPKLVMANDIPLTSIPQNRTNYLMSEGQNDFTGKRSIIDEIKGFGNQVADGVNAIIKKLKVGKIGDKDWDQIYYDNGNSPKTLPIAKQAGLHELKDASEDSTVAEILYRTLEREIDNPIIRMFYKNVLSSKNNSLVQIIQNRDNLLNAVKQKDRKAIDEINDKINKALSLSFYPANYKGERYWNYQINIEGLLKEEPEFILELAPASQNQSKTITLLDFTNLFDENGDISLNTSHANTILQNLIFDGNSIRYRGEEEFGNPFVTVQASLSVVRHANGIFTDEENEKYSQQEKDDIQKRNHDVLSAIVEGGGLVIEGPIDNRIDYAVITKPEEFNKQGKIVSGAARTALQSSVEIRLDGMMSKSELDTVEDKDKKQVINRQDYIKTKKWINKQNKDDNSKPQHNMWVTTLAKWVSGGFKKTWGKSEIKKDITLTQGSNADLVLRHVLWTSEYNRNSERDEIKKIPLDYSQSGEGYYTDQELEQQFGFKASHVKALAQAFTISLNQLREEKKLTFYTNVVKPKTTIEITDGEKTYTIPVAGELDMLAIDPDGFVHPIDFKTIRLKTIGKQELIRDKDYNKRKDTILAQMGDSFEGYSRQINIYQAGLDQGGFRVGEGYILAVPVAYKNDESVKRVVREDSEYGNEILMRTDENGNETEQYLDGLELFEATDTKEPVKLTYIPVEYKRDFAVDMQDIAAMEENDINFLRKNPQFADVIDGIIEKRKAKEEKEGPNKAQIKLNIQKPQKTSGPRMEGNTAVWEEDDEDVIVEDTEQSIGGTNANFNEIDRQITQLKALPNFNAETDMIELIVGDNRLQFTVKQLEDFKADIERNSEKEGFSAEEQLKKLTVDDLCTALSCRI